MIMPILRCLLRENLIPTTMGARHRGLDGGCEAFCRHCTGGALLIHSDHGRSGGVICLFSLYLRLYGLPSTLMFLGLGCLCVTPSRSSCTIPVIIIVFLLLKSFTQFD